MEKNLDLLIIGAGPAGITAGIYASRGNLKVAIIESELAGGKLNKTYSIENYPGTLSISGMELANKFVEHAKSYNVEIINATIDKLELKEKIKKIYLKNGDVYTSSAILIATGCKENTLKLDRANEFVGNGISYCAVCDGFFYRKKDVIIIGGGNSALEEALYLSQLVNKITIVIRRNQFRADKTVTEKVLSNEKIQVIYNSVPNKLIINENKITGLEIKDVNTNENRIVEASGIFPYIGNTPNSQLIDKEILNELGYIKVNPDMSTSILGVYAAGDVIAKDLRQVVTACNDGAIGASSIIKYLNK